MEKFTPSCLKALKAEFISAIADVCAKHGITPEFAGGSYSAFESTLKLKLKLMLPGSENKSKEDFAMFAPMYGLDADDLGRRFRSQGHFYTITGISPNRPKFPIDAERSDGKKFKFHVGTVQAELKRIDVSKVFVPAP